MKKAESLNQRFGLAVAAQEPAKRRSTGAIGSLVVAAALSTCWGCGAGAADGNSTWEGDATPGDLGAAPTTAALKEGQPPPDDDANLNPLIHIETNVGTRVSFYEPVPGYGILVTEAGSNTVEPVYKALSRRGLTPLEAFTELLPDQPIPEVLRSAQTRYEALMARGVSDAKTLADAQALSAEQRPKAAIYSQRLEAIGRRTQAYTNSQNGCSLATMQSYCWGSSSWLVCNLNMYNDSTYQHDDTLTYGEEVCVFTNQWVRWRLNFRTWWSWSTYGDFTVLGGTKRWVNNDGIFDFDVRSQVYDVAPDAYHRVASGATLF
jgi:hypothetical protein